MSLRPARDGMGYVTAFLPMPQALSVHGALKKEADGCCDGRGGGHVMADTLVERITGRPADVAVPTGTHHESNAPPLLADIATITPSGIERQLGVELTRHAA